MFRADEFPKAIAMPDQLPSQAQLCPDLVDRFQRSTREELDEPVSIESLLGFAAQ
jgi:hypothetical protein